MVGVGNCYLIFLHDDLTANRAPPLPSLLVIDNRLQLPDLSVKQPVANREVIT